MCGSTATKYIYIYIKKLPDSRLRHALTPVNRSINFGIHCMILNLA